MRSTLPVFLALVFLALHVKADGRVFVVDPDARPGSDFTELQEAVLAAAPGDVLLLRPIDSGWLFAGWAPIDGKALILTAAEQRAGAGVQIENLSPHDAVVLDGILSANLQIRGNLGSVFVQDTCIGAFWYPTEVTDTEWVIASGLFAAASPLVSQDETAGIDILRSRMALYETEAYGKDGFTYGLCPRDGNGMGGPGLLTNDSFVFSNDCSFQGGRGEDDCYPVGTEGGDGARLEWGSTLFHAATEFVAGRGGYLDDEGPPATPLLVDRSSRAQQLPQSARRIEAPRRVEAGRFVRLRFLGPPGESVELLVGSDLSPHFEDSLSGVQVTTPPDRVLSVGTIPPSGTLSRRFAPEELGLLNPRPEHGAWYYLQAVFRPSRDEFGRGDGSVPARRGILSNPRGFLYANLAPDRIPPSDAGGR